MNKVSPLESDAICSQQTGVLFGAAKHTLIRIEADYITVVKPRPGIERTGNRLLRKLGNVGETRVEKEE